MHILVSNDDGYLAKGVRELIKWLVRFGEVTAVCPDSARSGQSMAITMTQFLRLTEVESPAKGARMYHVNGTPVDCIKLASYALFRDRKPDLVIAGINHGSNAAVNVLYSGTMGAVMEGCLLGIPSIGFSLTDHSLDADFSNCRPFVERIVRETIAQRLPDGVCLNVNIPDSKEPPTEIRLTHECRGHWTDEYVEYSDPHGKPFYMVSGRFDNQEPENEDTDEWCLKHGIVSVTAKAISSPANHAGLPEWLRLLKCHYGSQNENRQSAG